MATFPIQPPAMQSGNQPGNQPGNPQSGKNLSQMVVLASSLFGGGGFAYLIFQLVREEPDRAFKLLNSWGPGYLLAIGIAYGVNKLLAKALDAQMQASDRSSAAVERVAVQMQSLAEATNAQALALQKTADKDDRDKQEMQILVGVVNSKVEQSMTEQRLQGKAIDGTLEEIKRQNRALQRIEDAMKINRPEESNPR